MAVLDRPRVLIGLPVFNGDNFLAEAIESILAQTFTNFHLRISDNASTDGTRAICEEYARRDSRISYHRQTQNLGATSNFNSLFQPNGETYFKWAAHDDLLAPEFLEETVRLLDAHPQATIAHCRSWLINEHGQRFETNDEEICLSGETEAERFWRILWANYLSEIFGLMRIDALAETRLLGSYIGADRNLIVEMLMLGDIVYCDKYLFMRRDHPESYVRAKLTRNERQQWFKPSSRIALPTQVSRTANYVRSILTMPISTRSRVDCLGALAHWAIARAGEAVSGGAEEERRDRLVAIQRERGVLSVAAQLERHSFAEHSKSTPAR